MTEAATTDAPAPRAKLALAALVAVVPLLGLAELGLHVAQIWSVVPDADWLAARELVKAEIGARDLLVFAPSWSDPLGRRFFGDELATVEREARPDETRFARAFEVSIRGARAPELAAFRLTSERRTGAVTVRLYDNPAPATIRTDLVDLARPGTLEVSRVEGGSETPCAFSVGASAGGSTVVPQGALVPAARYACPGGGFVGVAVLSDLEHKPRRCIFAPPSGGALRLRFSGVTFGATLHGHSGVQWMSERTPSAERVELVFTAMGAPLTPHVHKTGSGWTRFELPTWDLEGKRGELVVDVRGATSQRYFCFEADTR